MRSSTVPQSVFFCYTIRYFTVPPSNVLLLQHLCSTLSQWLFIGSTIRRYTVPPSDVPLFNHPCSTVLPSAVLLIPISLPLFHFFPIRCSTVLWDGYSTTMIVPLFHTRCSTVSPSDVPLFHYQAFQCLSITCSTVPRWLFDISSIRCFTVPPFLDHCSTIRCSTVPLWDNVLFQHQMFYCFTISVPLFHHQMFYCSSMIVPLFYHQILYFSSIRCSTVLPSDVWLFHH